MDNHIYALMLLKNKKELEKDTFFKELFSNAKYEKIFVNNNLSDKKEGINAVFDLEDNLLQIQLYRKGVEKNSQFAKFIPHGLNFNMTRDDVISKLGSPSESNEPVLNHPLFGFVWGSDKYYFSNYNYVITINYSKNNIIDIIGISPFQKE